MKLQLRLFSLFTMIAFVLMQTISFAQDTTGGTKTTNITTKTTTTETNTWYTEPWVWVVGAAVFIILIVAITRGNKSSSTTDRVTVTKEKGI